VAQSILVGFFGLFFLARAEGDLAAGRLADLQAVKALSQGMYPDPAGSPSAPIKGCREAGYPDGWRLGQVEYSEDFFDPELLSTALVGHTGAPALALYVYNSEFATVSIDSPLGIRHWFYLDPKTALEALSDPDDEPLEPPSDSETVDLLLRWSAEAGLPADEDELAAAFHQGPGPAGEGVLNLCRVLGVQVPRG
jgi:hypothetical protein